jgi:carbamoyl-phosphate synthase large subunit
MPARTDLETICVLGSGPIVIGQAAEFDYSGMQAVKALKKEGYRVVLINSNPATIMTDPEVADATYLEPMAPEVVAQILEQEKPDAVLPTVGGQTALNLAMDLAKDGTLERLGVELIGAQPDVIDRAENRELFKAAMDEIGLGSARSAVVHSVEEAVACIDTLGLPLVIRPSFTLGGSGGGIAHSVDELRGIVEHGIELSPTNEVLIEESLLGWKEYELELMRDKNDNVVIVCPIENLDPMGVHTGDSITVAPSMTLTDREYQIMRDAGIAILRKIGVETGGSNVQFSVNPRDGRLVVIEMNPRVSRSSALASKATGFPIAKVAAMLAIGYTLDEIVNDITQKTKAAFEPSIDYVVVKCPRFAFEKFEGAEARLTTQMKSVGEAMAIGRTFQESLGKALRSLELGAVGLEAEGAEKAGGAPLPGDDEALLERVKIAAPDRIWGVVELLRRGVSQDKVFEATAIDPWFLAQLQGIVDVERAVQGGELDAEALWAAKQAGLSDRRIAQLRGVPEAEVRKTRKAAGVVPVMKRVDTCAGEFEAHTPYLYKTYERPTFVVSDSGEFEERTACEARPTDNKKVMILGGGPIRIGQGIEFDYCCVHAALAVKAAGLESIMVNCNPETVSTDYDTADRLYFEPLTLEDVLDVCDREDPWGVIVQFGGQTPLKLAHGLLENGVRILGTPVDAIDRAEDRGRSTELVEKLGLLQPPGGTATSMDEAVALARRVGYPVMLRPSYVLGGRAMQTVHDEEGLRSYLTHAVRASEGTPVLVDRFLDGAIEVDVDVVSDGERAVIGGVMEHIEQAGVHSGDSACVLPPHSLGRAVVDEICDASIALALELGVVGLMNVQFAVRRNRVYVIEVNPRASRTVPFASKATGLALAPVATRAMMEQGLIEQEVREPAILRGRARHFAVKEVVLPFLKFPGVDTLLGPEMRSTGEVMGLHETFEGAFHKAALGAGTELPNPKQETRAGRVFFSVADVDKDRSIDAAARLVELGFEVLATGGTHRFLAGQGVDTTRVNKVLEGSPHIVDEIEAGGVDLIVNTTVGKQAIADSKTIRAAALQKGVPCYTTVEAGEAAGRAIERALRGALAVRPLQSYLERAGHQRRRVDSPA